MKLKEQLEQYKHTSRKTLAEGKRRILEEHVRNLQLSGVASYTVKVGSTAPNFALPDHEGNIWELAKALRSGPWFSNSTAAPGAPIATSSCVHTNRDCRSFAENTRRLSRSLRRN